MTASPSFLLLSILQNIRAGKRTAAFLILGCAVGYLLPVAILAAARHELLALHGGRMADSHRIIRLEAQLPAEPGPTRPEMRASGMELLRTLQRLDPAVESVSFKSEYTGILFDGRQYRYAGIVSADPSYIGLFRQYIRRGGGIHSGDGRECIVGTVLSREMWNGSGIGKSIRIGSNPCTVTGETDIHDKRVIIMETGREHFRGWTQFFVKVRDAGDVNAVLARIGEVEGSWKAERMDEVEQRETAQAYAMFTGVILVSLITLLYALLNVGNIMGLMLRERRKNYAVRMALGARPQTLRAEYGGELLIMTTASLLLAFGALKTGQPIVERHLFSMRLDLTVVLLAAAFNLLVCGIAGFVLFRRIRKPGIVRLMREADR